MSFQNLELGAVHYDQVTCHILGLLIFSIIVALVLFQLEVRVKTFSVLNFVFKRFHLTS